MINKNTYYRLSPMFLRASMSISRAKSGKYHLSKTDIEKGYYLTLTECNINLKVPFKALFETNKKIKPIISLSFSSALHCPSKRRGLCQLKDTESCYALNGQLRASGLYKNGIPCMNSILNSILVMECMELLKKDNAKFLKLCEYLTEKTPILRFNLKGDFKDITDLEFLLKLVKNCSGTVFYGYSARDDLLKGKNFGEVENFYLNGSNKKYTNRFKTTYNLYQFFKAPYICLGDCKKCKKCYTLKGMTIECLIHNKKANIILNTRKNRVILSALLRDKNPSITEGDFLIKKDLLESLNHVIKHKIGLDTEFNNFIEFRSYIREGI